MKRGDRAEDWGIYMANPDKREMELRMKSDKTSRRFSFPSAWRRDLCYIAFLAAFCLCSCEANLFGPDSREIAGGYRLKQAGNPNQFALTIPYQSGGLIIDEIGWREPYIIARASGSDYWEAIDTAHAQRIRISDQQRKSDPIYQSIPIQAAEIAWKDLNRRKRLW
jgi:hypothetical protein